MILFTACFSDLAVALAWPFLHSAEQASFSIGLKISVLCAFAIQISHQLATQDLAEAALHVPSPCNLKAALRASTFFPTGLLMACFGGWLIAGTPLLTLFGPSFMDAKWPVAILISAQLARAAFGPAPTLITLHGATKLNAGSALSCSVLLLVLYAMLVPQFGLWGACWAVLITLLAWSSINALLLYRLSGDRTDILFVISKLSGPAGAPVRSHQ